MLQACQKKHVEKKLATSNYIMERHAKTLTHWKSIRAISWWKSNCSYTDSTVM